MNRSLAKAGRLFHVRPAEITGSSRLPYIVRARDAIVWAGRRRGLSLAQAGGIIARTHTAALHAERRAERRRATDIEFAKLTDHLARVDR